ncbi:MAG: hypothetical protein IKW96_02270 [Ruminococcus sp.]|uniref:hypothetical protein n=1 Tax=Ruminococcus sp. TaxID=41978 RepID=UPI0025EA6544|nr:hypothetical protein [Ruminococcus sp.]MBR5682096.1 hypothetical protein [Ruminococcus sp.]
MEKLLLTIDVICREPLSVRGSVTEVVMVPFSGTAHSEHFRGEVMGNAVDTQKYSLSSGKCRLSARYMLQGTDRNGQSCRIFIENEQQGDNCWKPTIVTDSEYLRSWEKLPLTATVDITESGVTVRIYAQDV